MELNATSSDAAELFTQLADIGTKACSEQVHQIILKRLFVEVEA